MNLPRFTNFGDLAIYMADSLGLNLGKVTAALEKNRNKFGRYEDIDGPLYDTLSMAVWKEIIGGTYPFPPTEEAGP